MRPVRPDDAPSRPLGGRALPGVLWGTALELVVFLLLSAVLALGLVWALSFLVPLSEVTRPGTVPSATVEVLAALLAYLVVIRLIERRRGPVELRPGRLGGVVVGLLAGAAAFAVCYLVIVVLGGYRLGLVDGPDMRAVGAQAFVSGIGAGVAEEVLFRGVLLRLLERIAGTWWAVALSGLVFGLLHLGNPDATVWGALAIALEAGLLLGLLYAVTRNLWLLMGFHCAWNVIQGPVLGVPISGTGTGPSILRTTVTGPDAITGGAFGAEASVVTVLILLAVTAWLARRLSQEGPVEAPSWRRARRTA